jgi:hypothetical protein
MKKIAFTIIASRDAEFFINVANQLDSNKYKVIFYTFYGPAERRIRAAGYDVCNFHSNKLNIKDRNENINIKVLAEKYKIGSLSDMLLHELMTFNYPNESYLLTKCWIYLETLDHWLKSVRPDVVIQELGGFVAPMSLYYASRHNNIKHIFLEPMMFQGTIGFVEDAINYSIRIKEKLRNKGVKDYIKNYIGSQNAVIPKKDEHHFRDATLVKFFNFSNLRKLSLKVWYKYFLGLDQEYDAITNHVWRNFRMLINRKKLTPFYWPIKNLPSDKRYIYFPLHVPLDFQLTVRSKEWLNQIDLLERISNFLPPGVELWIKEHPAAIGAYSINELDKLLHSPNVKIIHPLENSFSIIHNASAVITINSKVGAEALMQGKPLFVLGQAFYRNHGISYDISSISELERELTDFLKNKSNLRPSNKKIQDFLNAVWTKSLPGELYVNTSENVNKFASSLIKALELGQSLKK